MKTLTKSNKWKFTISIKQYFNDDNSFFSIAKICVNINLALRNLIESIEDSNLIQDEKNHYTDGIEEIIESFEYCEGFTNGTIEVHEWDDYQFDGDLQSLFNSYLSELYNIADNRCENEDNVSEKFLWID